MGKIISIDIINVWLIALIIASFTMFQKIANILSIASFLLITSTLGASYFGYKYLTSPQFQTKILNMVLSDVQKLLPKMLDNAVPEVTGPSILLLDDKK